MALARKRTIPTERTTAACRRSYCQLCIDPHFLDFGTSWRCVVSFTPRPLYPRDKSLRYPLDRRLGGPHSRFGRHKEEKYSSAYRDSNSDPLVVQPVVSRYTDYGIPARPYSICSFLIYFIPYSVQLLA
jgi:hypothetical protein